MAAALPDLDYASSDSDSDHEEVPVVSTEMITGVRVMAAPSTSLSARVSPQTNPSLHTKKIVDQMIANYTQLGVIFVVLQNASSTHVVGPLSGPLLPGPLGALGVETGPGVHRISSGAVMEVSVWLSGG